MCVCVSECACVCVRESVCMYMCIYTCIHMFTQVFIPEILPKHTLQKSLPLDNHRKWRKALVNTVSISLPPKQAWLC